MIVCGTHTCLWHSLCPLLLCRFFCSTRCRSLRACMLGRSIACLLFRCWPPGGWPCFAMGMRFKPSLHTNPIPEACKPYQPRTGDSSSWRAESTAAAAAVLAWVVPRPPVLQPHSSQHVWGSTPFQEQTSDVFKSLVGTQGHQISVMHFA